MDKYFPHEVHHLRIILSHLAALRLEEDKIVKTFANQEYTRENSPEFLRRSLNDAKVVLTGWLSALMRIPFSFEKLDSTFRNSVVSHCQEYMFAGGLLQALGELKMFRFCFFK